MRRLQGYAVTRDRGKHGTSNTSSSFFSCGLAFLWPFSPYVIGASPRTPKAKTPFLWRYKIIPHLVPSPSRIHQNGPWGGQKRPGGWGKLGPARSPTPHGGDKARGNYTFVVSINPSQHRSSTQRLSVMLASSEYSSISVFFCSCSPLFLHARKPPKSTATTAVHMYLVHISHTKPGT